LNKICSSDIPARGTFYTYPDYIARRIDVRGYNPNGVILAFLDARHAQSPFDHMLRNWSPWTTAEV